MLEMILIGGSVGIIVAVAIVLFAIYRFQRRLHTVAVRQEGWEHAQEARQQQWQMQQERRTKDIEKRLTTQVEEIRQEWQHWGERDAARVAQLQEQYRDVTLRGSIEYEVAHLPYTGDAALPSSGRDYEMSGLRQVARLSNADLSERDLSRRYLVNADLRGANLTNANLFMADLTGACLVGANLTGADLSGASLTHADLRNATLVGANLLVADINNAILHRADLRNARGFSIEQLHTAIYDQTTLYTIEVEETQTRLPRIDKTIAAGDAPTLQSESSCEQADNAVPVVSNEDSIAQNGFNNHHPEHTQIEELTFPLALDIVGQFPEEEMGVQSGQEHRKAEERSTTMATLPYNGRKRAKAS